MLYKISPHALTRMQRRGIALDELKEALDFQKSNRPMRNRKSSDGKRLHILGINGLTVILAEPNIIITVYRYNRDYKTARRKERANQKFSEREKNYGSKHRLRKLNKL